MSGRAFDWPAIMDVAYRQLGLSPAAFWALTPAEFLILLGPARGAGPLRRDAFEALMARFPDQTDEDGHDRDG